MKRRRLGIAIAGLLIGLFLIANRGAYGGYFSGDDLDNIGWTPSAPLSTFALGIVSPQYYPQHFRPMGHLTFYLLATTARLRYKPYIGAVHLLHLVNAFLVWLLLRRLAFSDRASLAGVLFFLFPMAVFDALWKPMYLFDVWCCLFTLLCLLQWISGRWLLSLAFFWLAYKSKEHAVMIPLALAAYEYWLGERRWKRLAPFFAIAASFTLQAAWMNKDAGADYTLQFSLPALIRTLSFYTSRALIWPYFGLLIPFLPRLFPERRLDFGIGLFALLLVPLLALPARMNAAYLYVSYAGLAIAAAAASARFHWAWTAAALAFWIPFNYAEMRVQRKAALTHAEENRIYVRAVGELVSAQPAIRRFIYDGYPPDIHPWGIQGALRIASQAMEIELVSVEDKNLNAMFDSGALAMLSWDQRFRKLTAVTRSPGEQDQPYLSMSRTMPVWQLEKGWYQAEGKFRWTGPQATARLWRPARATVFQLEVNVGPKYISDVRLSRVRVTVDGEPIGSAEFTEPGWRTVRWPVKPGEAKTVRVELRTEPEYRPSSTDPRLLGIAVGGFGFQ